MTEMEYSFPAYNRSGIFTNMADLFPLDQSTLKGVLHNLLLAMSAGWPRILACLSQRLLCTHGPMPSFKLSSILITRVPSAAIKEILLCNLII